ncbi:unnamed protein product [Cuscuta epithymum]|uniref:Uncharacterized protein n=1 Tax=Cuscuta epithymum TaxID=186058 RepID=A0AAV0C7K5_9ASTE|nr:unnamed protein product [Cuscuta epithymum]
MFGSPIPSRMATNVICITIGPSAPSCPAHVRLVRPFQDGDECPMHRNRPLNAIVSCSCSARPYLPGWRRTSYAARSAPQRHHVLFMFGSPIPSRMAMDVLCSTIGPSAPSCQSFIQLAHPFQDGDERFMQHDRPLSAIVSRSRAARTSLPGWRRTSYAARSALQCRSLQDRSCPDHVRLVHPFQDGDGRLTQHDRPSSADRVQIKCGSYIPSMMATDVLHSMIGLAVPIVSRSCAARTSLPGWRRTSYAARSAPQRRHV